MNDPLHLADRLALAIVEHGPMPGSVLAIRVAARKATVMAELHANPRFEQLGHRRGSRWRLAAGNHIEPPWEPLGPNLGEGSRSGVTRAEFDLLARRVAELERQVAGREAPV